MTRPVWVQEFERFAGRELLAQATPGAAVGFAVNGQTMYTTQFGWRDRELGLPPSAETVFGLASVTKSFTAVAIMQLQEQGKLSVDDPVVKYLPEFRTPNPDFARRTTIHHFLTHTAGIPPLPAMWTTMRDTVLADPYVQQIRPLYEAVQQVPFLRSSEEFLAYFAEQSYTLLGAPGTRFSYCNDTYSLLGTIIERVGGKPLDAYWQDHVFSPCGMTRTAVSAEAIAGWDDVTQLYAKFPTAEVAPAPLWWQSAFPAARAAGGIKSCVTDMLRYLEIFRNGGVVGGNRILRPESVRAMTSPHFPLGPDEAYGYGLDVNRDFHGVTLLQHGGTAKGVKSSIFCLPEQGFTGVILTNIDTAPATKVTYGAVHAYLGLPADAPVLGLKEAPAPAAELAEYAGEYAAGNPPLRIQVGAAGLEANMGKDTFNLRYVRRDLFVMTFAGTDETVAFLRGSNGEIEAVFFHLRTILRN